MFCLYFFIWSIHIWLCGPGSTYYVLLDSQIPASFQAPSQSVKYWNIDFPFRYSRTLGCFDKLTLNRLYEKEPPPKKHGYTKQFISVSKFKQCICGWGKQNGDAQHITITRIDKTLTEVGFVFSPVFVHVWSWNFQLRHELFYYIQGRQALTAT